MKTLSILMRGFFMTLALLAVVTLSISQMNTSISSVTDRLGIQNPPFLKSHGMTLDDCLSIVRNQMTLLSSRAKTSFPAQTENFLAKFERVRLPTADY